MTGDASGRGTNGALGSAEPPLRAQAGASSSATGLLPTRASPTGEATSVLDRLPLLREQDVVTARQRARQIARLLGFDNQDQARIATAVSEML